MNYRDFYKSNKTRKDVVENMEEKELLKGINLEDNACDDGLPKREDGSLDTAHDGRPIHLSKIIQIGRSFGSEPANGELNGFTAAGGSRAQEKDFGGVKADQPGDKEPMLAGGKKMDSSVVSKSVGGPISPGEGQKQGGLNTKGNIAGTPELDGGKGENDSTELSLQEAKNRIKSIVKEVLKEITFDKQSGKWIKKQLNEYFYVDTCKNCGHDVRDHELGVCNKCGCKKFESERNEVSESEVNMKMGPSYKVVQPNLNQTSEKDWARTNQYDPEITEMHDEEEECMMNERYSQLVNAQRNLSEAELHELKDLGMKLERFAENDENHKEHEHTEVDLVNVIKKAVDKLGSMHKGMEEEGLEEEKFLQKGIKKSHKGYCTPMTKKTCTPRRKALAKRLKPGGDLYKGEKDETVNEFYYPNCVCGHAGGEHQGNGACTKCNCKKFRADTSMKENTVDMKMGPSYKVVQPNLNQTAEKDWARTNQYDPEMTEAGGAAVQHSSYRTANYAPQLPKNRHRGDIDENKKV